MQSVVPMMMLWSVLVPSRQWVAPSQPFEVTVKSPVAITLVLTDFTGSAITPAGSPEVTDGKTVDVKRIFPSLSIPATYLLFAVPRGKREAPLASDFVGTPLVISVREDRRVGAPSGAMVTRVQPLQYALIATDAGEMTVAFFYDAAPTTIDNFLRLAGENFYDGLAFHTILPGYTIQGGDPKGDGTGGPGYSIDAEFSSRRHGPGVISMSRMRDPLEDPTNGVPPRPEYANSAGSQFFICLDEQHAARFDGRYTTFAKIVGGLDVLKSLAATPLADAKRGRPEKPPVTKSIAVKNVDPEHNPYKGIVNFGEHK